MRMKNFQNIYIYILVVPIIFIFVASISSNNTAQNSEWKAPAKADKLVNPLKDMNLAAEKGKELFDSQCVICHGEYGKGDGIAGVGLTPRPADLTTDKVQKQSDGAIYWKITTGNPPMASYAEIYSDTERWQLVAYIRLLGKNN